MQQTQELKPFTPYQKFVIVIIALIQFTVVLDFMVISPISPVVMKALDITPHQFSIVVAAYAISAGISGIFAAGFADKFDRKKFLMVFYIGFVIGTLFCALAPTYETLVAARIFTGLFGGVIGAISMAIITDLFEINQRGRVFGFTQMGFSASQVLGIPIGYWMANEFGWNSPFYMIVVLAAIMGAVMVVKLKPVTAHLALQKGTSSNALPHLWNTLKEKKYITGYIATALLPLGGFMLMPFSSVFAQYNLGVSEKDLIFVLVSTGIASMAVFPIIGRLSDKYNKMAIFAIASAWSIIMVVVHTHWYQIPMWLVITSSILMFSGIMGRIVPSTILISALPEMKDRGAFMAINSSLQQFAGGIAAIIAGFIVIQETPESILKNIDIVGYVVGSITLIAVYVVYRVYNLVKAKLPPPKAKQATSKKQPEPVLVGE